MRCGEQERRQHLYTIGISRVNEKCGEPGLRKDVEHLTGPLHRVCCSFLRFASFPIEETVTTFFSLH